MLVAGLGAALLFSACAVRSEPGLDAGAGGSDTGSFTADAERPDAPFVPSDAGPAAECRAVDVLFVIDNSASMADQQAALIASFDGFVAGMRARLTSGLDFHIGVVSTDDYYANEAGCTGIGDLITETGGIESSMRYCGPFRTGGRYLDNHDPALEARFACIAQLGIGGSDDERVARAFLNAADPTRPCNAGFLRPDALLVAVLITDEDDVADGCDGSGTCLSYGSGGLPDDWLAELTTMRDPSSVVMLSLIGRRAGNPCGAVVASRVLGFTNRFGSRGHIGDVCASSYDEFFTESLPVIATACEELF